MSAEPGPSTGRTPQDDAGGNGVGDAHKDDRDRPRLPLEGKGRYGRAHWHDDVGLHADQLLRERSYPINVIVAKTKLYPHVAAIGPTQVRKRLSERGEETLPRRIALVAPDEHADPRHPVALLRPTYHRPRRRAAKPSDEFPPPHS